MKDLTKKNILAKKINDYLNVELSKESESLALNESSDKFFLKTYPSEIDTNDFSGFELKLVELHNTLFKLTIGNYLRRSKRQQEQSEIQQYFIDFCKKHNPHDRFQIANSDVRIFVDITYTMKQVQITGIPRVVTEIINCAGGQLTPVFLYDKNVYALNETNTEFYIVAIRESDFFIFPDAAWNYPQNLHKTLSNIAAKGAKSIILLYDLIPLLYPQLSNQNHVNAFQNWLNIIISHASYVVCISQSVMHDFINLMENCSYNNTSIKSVGSLHLGSDFNSEEPRIDRDFKTSQMIIPQPYFLSVGTIEPRKAHSVTIDAMEKLWERQLDASFVIVGKYGWSQSRLKERILKHREYQKRLFWFDAATDMQLKFLYSNALALVSSSLSEGFGLPLIEAAHNGLSSIVSDIPVFREIGGDSTRFFEVTNSQELAFQLETALKHPKVQPDLDFLTWDESISRLINMIINDEYQYNNSSL